jgi:hypothetical protein
MSVIRKRLRSHWLLFLAHLFFVAAGASSMFIPPASVLSSTGQIVTYVWAGFFILGGVLCASPIVTGQHIGELTGLPLLVSSVLVLGVVLIYRTAAGEGSRGAAVVGFLACALAAHLASRWVEVYRLHRPPKGDR